MLDTLGRPRFWLVIGLEWPEHATGPHAECAFAIAPPFSGKRVVPPTAYPIIGLANAMVPPGDQQVVMLGDLTRILRQHDTSWYSIGVPNLQAAVDDLESAPIPLLYMELSSYAHTLLCTAGTEVTEVYRSDGRKRPNPESDREDMRNEVRALLMRDWPPYIEELERTGRISGPTR